MSNPPPHEPSSPSRLTRSGRDRSEAARLQAASDRLRSELAAQRRAARKARLEAEEADRAAAAAAAILNHSRSPRQMIVLHARIHDRDYMNDFLLFYSDTAIRTSALLSTSV